MNRALIASVVAGSAVQLVLPLLLEIGLRVFRIPLFPGFAPLLTESRLAVRLGYAAVLCAVEIAFLGVGAWEFVVACGMAAAYVQRRRWRFFGFTIVAAGVWLVLGVATRSLGAGSFGFETLLSAVFVRLTGSEVPAGALARLLLAVLVYASVVLVGLAMRPFKRLVPAMAAATAAVLVLNGCADGESTAFRPGDAAGSEVVRIDYGEAALHPQGHPILPGDVPDNGRCLSCHRARIGPTNLRLVEKGFHEIHYEVVRVAPPCTSCHAGAGRPGFPGEYPQARARHAYNQSCAACHSGAEGPFWARRMR